MSSNQSRERRARQALRAKGYQLAKSSRQAHGPGYMIVDAATNCAVSGQSPVPYFDTIEDVEAFAQGLP